MEEKILLINLKNYLPHKKYIESISGFYQIGTLDEDYSYLKCLNNQSRLNKIAIEEREQYSDWIADLNKHFLSKNLTYKSKISLFYFSDLSNKRNDIFNTFDLICNRLLIEEIISKNGYTKILINGGNKNLFQSISSIKNIKTKKINNWETYNMLRTFTQNISNSLITRLLRNLRLIFKYTLYRIFFLKIVYESKNKTYKCNNIFFTRFPKHFQGNIYKEDKYLYMVKKNDQFVTSLLCDGMYQNLGILNAILFRNSLKKSKKHIIIDDYITFKNLIRSFYESIILFNKFKYLNSIEYYYKDINISDSIYKELSLSYQRVLGTLVVCRGLKNVIKNIEAKKYIYHLHEYIYGRMITFVLHNKGIRNTFGFQHGPSSLKLLLYNNSSKELPSAKHNYLNSVPLPHSVFAEDKKSANIYKLSGYKNIILLSKIPRLFYLYDLRLKNKKDINLIASGLHDFQLIYRTTLKEIQKKPNLKFLFKPHPRSNINLENYPLPDNAQYTKSHIKNLLTRTNKLYATYSSVLSEAMFLNINVYIIQFPGKVCLSSYEEEN